MKMEQNQFFNLTGKIREEYIAEATGWKHHGTVQSKASGKVSGDGQMSPADTRAAKRDDRRIRMMAAGGVAVAAAFALTVGAVLHGFGSVPISPETGMSATEQTEGSYNLYGGKGTLRFVGGNPLLLEDDNYYYSPVWEIFRAKKSDANENGAMPMIFDLSKQIVDSEIALYPGAQFSGKPLYYHADEGKTAIYMRDDNGREFEPLFFKQSFFTDANSEYPASRAEITRLMQLGTTDAYFAELTLYDDADGAATKVCAAILRPESLDILGEEAYSNANSGWYAAYDEVQNRAYCYYVTASGKIENMIDYDMPDENSKTGAKQDMQNYPDFVHVRYPYYDSSTASSALNAYDGKLYYFSHNVYCEMDAETGEVRELNLPYTEFNIIGGKIYAITEDLNVVRCNLDGSDVTEIYSGSDAYFIPPQNSPDAIVILTENQTHTEETADGGKKYTFNMVVLLSDGSRLTFYADQDNPPAVTEAPAETTVPAETTLPAETTTEAAAVLPLEQIPPHSNEYPVRTAEEVDAILEKGIEDFKQYGRQPIDTAPYLALFDSVPEGEQAEIAQNYLYHMMLNSVDHYDTADVYMTYAMNGTENAIRVEAVVDFPRGTALECNNETGKVFYTVQDGKLTTFPDGIRTVTDIPKHAEFTIPDNDRIAIESGSPNTGFITLRRSFLNELNVAGVAALASLLPQDIAMTHLHDFTQWKITEVGETGGRKNALIEGMYTDLPFEMKVDLETGILLGVWQYDGNYNLTGYAEIDSIIVDGQWPE